MFRFDLPLVPKATGQATGRAEDRAVERILSFCEEPRKASEIQKLLGLSHRETFQDNYLKPLLKQQLLILTIPDKPRSPSQQYRITKKGRMQLKKYS